MEGNSSTGKKLGFISIVLLGINSIIGSGIFLLPNKVYAEVGVSSLFVLLAITILVLSLALCYAEVSSKFETNGSSYVYAKESFGKFAGFQVGIFTWMSCVIGWAAETEGLLTALGGMYPIFSNYIFRKSIAITIFILLGILNYHGVKISKILNNVSTLGKIIPLTLFIVIGIIFLKGANFHPVMPVDTSDLTFTHDFGVATLVLFYAFAGFEVLPIAAEDMENPRKNIPKAIITVITFCAVYYALILIGSIGILGKNLAFTKVPLALATGQAMGQFWFDFMTWGAVISIGGITIAYSFAGPRSAQALAEDSLLPKSFAEKNKYGAPGRAIIASTIIAILLSLSGNFIFLAALSIVARFIQYIPTALSVLVLRKRQDLPQGYRVPLGPVIPIFAVVVCIWLITQAQLEQLAMGAAVFVLGSIVYFIFLRKEKKN